MRNPFRGDGEVDALAAGDLQRCDSNNLALHVDDWAPTRSRRDGRGDLDNAAKTGNVAHRRNNSVCHAAFQAEGIADYDYTFAFLRRSAIERKRADQIRRRFDFQDRDVAFGIDRQYVFDLEAVPGVQMNFTAIGTIDHVAIRHDAISIYEEAAAARKPFSPRVESFDGHRGWFDSSDEIRELILRVCPRQGQRKDKSAEEKSNSVFYKARAINCLHYVLSITRDQMFCAAGAPKFLFASS